MRVPLGVGAREVRSPSLPDKARAHFFLLSAVARAAFLFAPRESPDTADTHLCFSAPDSRIPRDNYVFRVRYVSLIVSENVIFVVLQLKNELFLNYNQCFLSTNCGNPIDVNVTYGEVIPTFLINLILL